MKTVLELEDLASRAVKAALNQQWQDAVTLNQEILADTPDSIEANNRLARAYHELGQINEAKMAYKQVLSIDPYNSIAQKNLSKLEQGSTTSASVISKELFVEEPGKTRSTPIVNPKAAKVSQYSPGEELQLEIKDGQLAVMSRKGELLGFINEELGNHLIKLMHLGNEYSAHLLNASETPQVFLREAKQSTKAARFISFARTATSNNHLGTPKSLPSDDSTPMDGNLNDEDVDNWDSDDAQDDLDMDGDDFDSVSFEQMRDEEEGSYSGRGDDY